MNSSIRLNFNDNEVTLGYVDSTATAITGWITSCYGKIYEIKLIYGANQLSGIYGKERKDVARACGKTFYHALLSGFLFNAPMVKVPYFFQVTFMDGSQVTSQELSLYQDGVSREALLERVTSAHTALEISPFSNPLLRGDNISYFALGDSACLKAIALSYQRSGLLSFNPENVPDKIHFVSPNGDLSIVNQQFDFVVSSHVVEHVYDLASHLIAVQKLLKLGGQYILFIPDKRYTFDYFKPLSTFADVLDVYYLPIHKLRLKNIIEGMFFLTHNDPVRHWAGDHGCLEPYDFGKIGYALEQIKEFPDIHHIWTVTDEAFLAIVECLNKINIMQLRCSEVYPAPQNTNTFYAVLTKE